MAAATIPVSAETKSPAPLLMELAIDRGQFLAEVQAATRVTEGKSTVPILTHLLLRTTTNGALSVTGSDLQRTITTECPAAVKSQGAAAVPAQKLLTYLKLLPNGQVNLKLLGNDRLQITAANSRTKIPGMKPESYPAIPVASGLRIRLSARVLRTVIRQSLFAVATSQDKYLLNAGLLLLRSDRMGIQRWGASDMMERAFTGFKALTDGPSEDWRQVLGFDMFETVTRKMIESHYRELVKQHHPDMGGDREDFERVMRAREAAIDELTYSTEN
jgi:hypothetical protein